MKDEEGSCSFPFRENSIIVQTNGRMNFPSEEVDGCFESAAIFKALWRRATWRTVLIAVAKAVANF